MRGHPYPEILTRDAICMRVYYQEHCTPKYHRSGPLFILKRAKCVKFLDSVICFCIKLTVAFMKTGAHLELAFDHSLGFVCFFFIALTQFVQCLTDGVNRRTASMHRR
jgi:hypothetical protein